MSTLTHVLPYLAALVVAMTVIVLFSGVYTMGSDDPDHARKSNILMRWRVALQGVVVGLVALFFMLAN